MTILCLFHCHSVNVQISEVFFFSLHVVGGLVKIIISALSLTLKLNFIFGLQDDELSTGSQVDC